MQLHKAVKKRYDMTGPRIAAAFKKNHFDAYYVSTADEALEKAIELIPEDHVISWGGSETLKEIGLTAYLKENNYKVIDRSNAKSQEEREELMKKALLADTYLMSCNGASEDGQLVNIDGTGNRVAAMIYGPTNVIVIAGMNKVEKTVEDAWKRARNLAAPTNMQRFSGVKTPCSETGLCSNCTSTDSICAYFVATRISRPAEKIKVILVGENLGF